MNSTRTQFEAAQTDLRRLSKRPDNETLLELYSFYKQATEGDAAGERPRAFDFTARAKFEAWEARRGMTKEEAMKAYIKLVTHLGS